MVGGEATPSLPDEGSEIDMSSNSLRPQLVESTRPESASVPKVPREAHFPAEVEIIDTDTLAARWKMPPSWIRTNCGNRVSKDQRIPCLRLGRYVRFRWNSPELNAWLESRAQR